MSFWNKQPATGLRAVDISRQVHGKYQHCTSYEGVFYSDEDFDHSFGVGKPRPGAIPAPSEADRTPFGQKRKPVLESEQDKRSRREREKIETQALLEHLAAEQAARAAPHQEAWLAEYVTRHEDDMLGWSFDCKKHGSFLSLFVTRGSNAQAKHVWHDNPTQFSTTLNLAGCRQIMLKHGSAPSLLGRLEFTYTLQHSDGKGYTIGGTGHGCYKAPEGSRWEVRTPEIAGNYSRPIMYFAEAPSDRHGSIMDMDNHEYKIKTKLENAAAAASDDRIEFEGLRATLFIPATLGDRVHTRILAELAAV